MQSPPWGGVTYLDPSSLKPSTSSTTSQSPAPTSSPTQTPTAIVQIATTATLTKQVVQPYTDLYPLSALAPISGQEMFKLSQEMTTNWKLVDSMLSKRDHPNETESSESMESGIISQHSNVALYLPRNVDLEEVARLGLTKDEESEGSEIVVEEQWMGNRLKAIVCYFGELAKWQEGKGWEE